MNNRIFFEGRTNSSMFATAAQRSEIIRLSRMADLDPSYVTIMHRRIGVSDLFIGKHVSDWLGAISLSEASRVIGALKRMVDDVDGDELSHQDHPEARHS